MLAELHAVCAALCGAVDRVDRLLTCLRVCYGGDGKEREVHLPFPRFLA